jgi:hypothetical protein
MLSSATAPSLPVLPILPTLPRVGSTCARPALPVARDEALTVAREAGSSLPLRAWRGRSGRRYVVSVYPLDEADDGYAGALLLAVARDPEGRRHLVAARESGAAAVSGYNGQWLSAARERGANELHIHLLAASHAERRSTLDDLGVS